MKSFQTVHSSSACTLSCACLLHKLFAICICVTLAMSFGCSSPSVKPDPREVTVGRELPSPDCKELGPVKGTTMSKDEGSDEALKDMIKEASLKLANFVKVEEYSGYGGSVTGIAYQCP